MWVSESAFKDLQPISLLWPKPLGTDSILKIASSFLRSRSVEEKFKKKHEEIVVTGQRNKSEWFAYIEF